MIDNIVRSLRSDAVADVDHRQSMSNRAAKDKLRQIDGGVAVPCHCLLVVAFVCNPQGAWQAFASSNYWAILAYMFLPRYLRSRTLVKRCAGQKAKFW